MLSDVESFLSVVKVVISLLPTPTANLLIFALGALISAGIAQYVKSTL